MVKTAPLPLVAVTESAPAPLPEVRISEDDIVASNFTDKDVTYSDIVKATNNEMMGSAGRIATARAVGTVGAATGPLGVAVAGGAYLGTEAYYLAKNVFKSGDENAFWNDYYRNVNDAMDQNSTLAGFVDGSSIMTGHTVDERLEPAKHSTGFTVGNMAGLMFRDVTAMLAGGAVAGPAGATAGFVAVPAIANGVNHFQTEMGNNADIVHAAKIGLAHGAATGLTGLFFMKYFDKILRNVSTKLVDTQLGSVAHFVEEKGIGAAARFGTEMSGWAVSEDVLTTATRQALGDKDAEMTMTPAVAAAMFSGGALLGYAGRNMSNLFKNAKIAKATAVDVAEDGVVDIVEALAKVGQETQSVSKSMKKDMTTAILELKKKTPEKTIGEIMVESLGDMNLHPKDIAAIYKRATQMVSPQGRGI